MSLVSLGFLAFLCGAMLVYYLLPRSWQWKVMLTVSLVFCILCSYGLTVFVLVSAIFAYGFGRIFARKKCRGLMLLFVLILCAILVILKYAGLFSAGLAAAFGFLGMGAAVPLGISYYTLALIGYAIDVYRDTIESETNFAKILLFTVYFPTLTQGPINRYGEIKGQLFAEHAFSYKNMTFGLKRILWGFFKKLVLAERLAVLVDTTYAGLAAGSYGGAVSLIAMAGFLLQLYFDFSGCIDIVIGASEMFGIALPENFSHPFASTSVAEFWRRWHVTLGSWLKDYVLFGFTMSGLSKKMSKGLKAKFGRKAATTIISVIGVILVWAVNGPWHGIEPNFLWLAGFFALILVIGAALEPVTKKFNKANAKLVTSGAYKIFRAAVTFVLVMWGAFFVKGDAFMAAGRLFSANVSPIITRGSEDLMILGLDIYDFSVLAAGIILWIVVARVSAGAEKKFEEQTKTAAKAAAGNALAAGAAEDSSAGNALAGASLTPVRRDFRDLMMNWPLVLRWLCLIIMIVAVVLFGMYGDGFEGGSFIYQGF